MNCVVTAGPTYEPLDEVRRLTNFSTGRLGTELANFLVSHGHHVTLLAGKLATYCGERRAQRVETFTTTASLHEQLMALSSQSVKAVFHAAAVSDFAFGKIWSRSTNDELIEVKSRKICTRDGSLLAELVATPKIIRELRAWFPAAFLTGWKYEADGKRLDAIHAAEQQLTNCFTDACVTNGPAYGDGFGLVKGAGRCEHITGPEELFKALEKLAAS